MIFLAWGVMNLFFWLWLLQKRIKNCDPNFFYLYYRKLQKWFISSFFNEKSNIWPQFWKKSFLYVAQNQRSYTRWLYKRIYKPEMKFWAVLGCWGCREKKTPNCHRYATFWCGFFNFLWANFYFLWKCFCARTEKLHNMKLCNI